MIPSPPNDLDTFLAHLFPAPLPDGQWAHLWYLDGRRTKWVRSVADIKRALAAWGNQDVYIGVGLADHEGANDERIRHETVSGIVGVVADIDIQDIAHKHKQLPTSEDEALAWLDTLPLQPTMLVQSGHGLQAWWLYQTPRFFTDDTERQRSIRVMRAWQRLINDYAAPHGWVFDAVNEPSRILRLPGTVNAKVPDTPVPVRLLRANGDRYTPDQIAALCETGGAELERRYGSVSADRRYTDARRCPVCHGAYDDPQGVGVRCWGFISDDRQYAHCTREDVAGNIRLNENSHTYPHRLYGECLCGTIHRPAEDNPDGDHAPPPLAPSVLRDANERGYHLNDTGNGRRLADRFSGDYRYVPELKRWIHWDGLRWEYDTFTTIQERVKDIAQDVLRDAINIPDTAQFERLRKQWFAWATASGQATHLAGTLRAATTAEGFPIHVDQLDQAPDVIAFRNGYYDLATGQLRPPRRDDFITRVCACDYNEHAKSPRFNWLMDTFLPNLAMRRDLQLAIGYCLSNRAKEHLFIAYSETKRGKSTFFNAVRRAMGDYANVASIDTFTNGNFGADTSGRPREDLTALVGRRLIVASEANRGVALNSGLIKNITGNDPMKIRALYSQEFTMLPIFGLWLLVNDYPRLPADDDAVWERVHVFRFTQYIEREDRNEEERDRLLNDPQVHEAIMAWAIEGWHLYHAAGRLLLPTTVEESLAYRREVDPLTIFLEECCEVREGEEDTFQHIKSAFHRWARSGGTKADYNDTRLGLALAKRFTKAVVHNRSGFQGIRVLPEFLPFEAMGY